MTEISNNIRQSAYKFECIFQSMRKTKDHISLTVSLHPHEVPRDLLADPIGSRYMAALVRINDDEEIIPPRIQMENSRLVQAAGMLCRDEKFQQWLIDSGCANELNEESAGNALRRLLCIDSRRQIGEEEQTAEHFKQIKEIFEAGQLMGKSSHESE
tara:strand:- start:1050 stop:1520 length:471 start_codon:yes stop_codon:yes gene_type:complete